MAETGTECFYPPTRLRLNTQELEWAGELSVSHAVGEIVPLGVDPDQYPFQGAWRINSRPLPPAALEYVAGVIYPQAPKVLASLQTGVQVEKIHALGELLQAGHTVMNTIPHSTILDIGAGHGLTVIALKNLGYDFRSAMVVSQGVTQLGRRFNGQVIPVPNFLGYMCDIDWFVYPNTDKTANSALARNAGNKLKSSNSLGKEDMLVEQRRGGLFITSAVNATSFIRGRNGEHLLAGITPGTIETMTEQRTKVQKVLAASMATDEPLLELCDVPMDITTADEAHDLIGLGMAQDLSAAFPDQDFVYLDPREGLTAGIFQ